MAIIPGSTCVIKTSVKDMDITLVDNAIFSFSIGIDETPLVQKKYQADNNGTVKYLDGAFITPCTQQDTLLFDGNKNILYEAQLNFKDKSVSKTIYIKIPIRKTVATEVITGNAPNINQDENYYVMQADTVQYLNVSTEQIREYVDLTQTYSLNAEKSEQEALEHTKDAENNKQQTWEFLLETKALANETSKAKDSVEGQIATATDLSNKAIEAATNAENAKNTVLETAEQIDTDKSVVLDARTDILTAKQEVISAKSDAITAKDEAVTAKDAAITASEEAIAAKETAVSSATAAKQSEENAKKSETEAGNSKVIIEQAMKDLLAMLGNKIATLTEDGKLTPSQIPNLSIINSYAITDISELVALDAQLGDMAYIKADGKVTDVYWLADNDATVADNWLKFGVSFVQEAGNAQTAVEAENAQKINGHRLVEMAADEFEAAVKDDNTYYLVY